jgi:hypothetical protein
MTEKQAKKIIQLLEHIRVALYSILFVVGAFLINGLLFG